MIKFERYNKYPEARNRLSKCVRILSYVVEEEDLMKLSPMDIELAVFKMLNSNDEIVEKYFRTKGIKYDNQCKRVKLKS
jgi:hypothetical protein